MGNVEEDGMHLPCWKTVQVKEFEKFPRSNGCPPSDLTTKWWMWIFIYAITTKRTGEKGVIVEETSTCGWADEGQLDWT